MKMLLINVIIFILLNMENGDNLQLKFEKEQAMDKRVCVYI